MVGVSFIKGTIHWDLPFRNLNGNRRFTDSQLDYLHLIKKQIAASLTITARDLTEVPFSEKGGLGRARQLFGSDLNPLLIELNQTLAA